MNLAYPALPPRAAQRAQPQRAGQWAGIAAGADCETVYRLPAADL